MEGLTRKVTSVAIAALLLLWVVFPVPSNVAALDRLRYEKALANPGIGVMGSAAYAAGVAILAGAGIMVAANTLEEWSPQSERLVNDFVNYVNANGYYNEYSGDLSQYVDATGQNVNLQQAYADGIYDMLQQYLDSVNAQALLKAGDASNAAPGSLAYDWEGEKFPCTLLVPNASKIQDLNDEMTGLGYTLVAYRLNEIYSDGRQSWSYFYKKEPLNLSITSSGDGYLLNFGNCGQYTRIWDKNGHVSSTSWGGYSNSINARTSNAAYNVARYIAIPVAGLAITVNGAALGTGTIQSEYAGVYRPELVNQRIAEIASGAVQKVHVINPTAEQLEAGLTYQDVISAQLSGISTGVEGLDASVNTLIGVASSIATMISSTLLGQYCATVTNWLGSTPFGNVMGTVIDGVTDIPGHVDDAAQTVAGGVAALPGAIEGVLEGLFPNSIAIPGILQGTLEGVQAIPGTIADVVTAVQTGVLDITGAIESVMQPSPNLPRLNDEPVAIALPPAFQANIQEDLRERVPFCYVVHMQEALQGLSGNLSYSSGSGLRAQSNYDMRSFYFDVEIPYAGEVRFDAEPFLSQSFGALDIATTIRILVSVLLCYGLLFRAYKVVERAF